MEEIKHANIANQPRVDATNVASEPSSMIDAHSDKDRHDEIEYKSHRKESVLISVSDLQDLKMILKKKVTNTEMMHNVKNIIMMIGVEVLAAHVIMGNEMILNASENTIFQALTEVIAGPVIIAQGASTGTRDHLPLLAMNLMIDMILLSHDTCD